MVFVKGDPRINRKGRPKGKTLKEYAREFLMSMSDEDKKNFLNSLNPDVLWRMAEGNPHQTKDITSGGHPLQFTDVAKDSGLPEDSPDEQED